MEGVDFRLGGLDFSLEGGYLSLEVACEVGALVILLVVHKHVCLDIRGGMQYVHSIYVCIQIHVHL